MLDELKERNILKLILIVRFVRATLDVGLPIYLERAKEALVQLGLVFGLENVFQEDKRER
jgi:hypothetical protein